MRPPFFPFFPNKFAHHEFEIDDEGKIFINGREIDIEQTNIKLIAFLNHTKKILTRSKTAQTQKTKEEKIEFLKRF